MVQYAESGSSRLTLWVEVCAEFPLCRASKTFGGEGLLQGVRPLAKCWTGAVMTLGSSRAVPGLQALLGAYKRLDCLVAQLWARLKPSVRPKRRTLSCLHRTFMFQQPACLRVAVG